MVMSRRFLASSVTTKFFFPFFKKAIPINNRAQLIDDAFNLARYCTEVIQFIVDQEVQ